MVYDNDNHAPAPPLFKRWYNYFGEKQTKEVFISKILNERLRAITLTTLIEGLQNKFSKTFKRNDKNNI